MAVIFLDRDDWGADPALPRLGAPVDRAERTEVFVHHTVETDDDPTPNEWESLDEVRREMRRLQVIRRQDLGADVPYSFVLFCMASGDLAICEGRGFDRQGAHTVGHNRSALGLSFQGNFELEPLPAHFDAQLSTMGEWLRSLRTEQGFDELGSLRPADRQLWGHRDVKATACPGRHLFDRLAAVRYRDDDDFLEVSEMAMDEATWKTVQRSLQALDPPLYADKPIDGRPGRFTSTSVQAFERRMELEPRGVIGTLGSPQAGIWPATRELLFAAAMQAVTP